MAADYVDVFLDAVFRLASEHGIETFMVAALDRDNVGTVQVESATAPQAMRLVRLAESTVIDDVCKVEGIVAAFYLAMED